MQRQGQARGLTFFSFAELSEHVAQLLEELNRRPMRVYRASRQELFERLDCPALRPLPHVTPPAE